MQSVVSRCTRLNVQRTAKHAKPRATAFSGIFPKPPTVKRSFELAAHRHGAGHHLLRCSGISSSVPVNKELGGTIMTDQLYGYLLAHTHEHEVLRWLRNQTAEQFPVGARMQVSPEQAQFLAWLVKATRSRKALELGVFTGYSSLAIAQALPPDGNLIACDRDPRPLKLAQEAFEKAGIAHKVTIKEAPALATLNHLLQQPDQPNTFDFIFIDADKRSYAEYYELCLQLVKPGGIIALDNVLWYGKVADPEILDKRTAALRHLNDELRRDKRIMLSMVPVGDGIALCLKH